MRRAVALAAACVLLAGVASVAGELVAAAVIPHGDFAYDPSLVHNANRSLEVHNASVMTGAWLAGQLARFNNNNNNNDNIQHNTSSASKRQPPALSATTTTTTTTTNNSLLLLITPHGIEDSRNFVFYANSNGSGYALLGQDLHNASFPCYKVPLNASLAGPNASAAVLSAVLRAAPFNLSALTAFADGQPIELGWGEVIPLTFLRAVGPLPPVLVLSVPTRRYTDSVAMIPEMLALGEALGQVLAASAMRVGVLVSADLAHTHEASGPYGFSAAAAPFDRACARWADTLSAPELLDTAASLVDRALSCGFPGMVILHGMLSVPVSRRGDADSAPARVSPASQWTPQLLARAAPTYYGMLAARFARR